MLRVESDKEHSIVLKWRCFFEAVLTPDQRINCRSLLEAKALNRFLDDFVVDAELGEALYPSSFHFVDLTDDVLLEFFLIEKQLPQRFGFRNVFLWIE